MNIDFSELKAGTYGIIKTEIDTGILLDVNGERSYDGKNCLLHAEDIEEARMLAESIVKNNSKIECAIRDHLGNHIEFVYNTGLEDSLDLKKSWIGKILSYF